MTPRALRVPSRRESTSAGRTRQREAAADSSRSSQGGRASTHAVRPLSQASCKRRVEARSNPVPSASTTPNAPERRARSAVHNRCAGVSASTRISLRSPHAHPAAASEGPIPSGQTARPMATALPARCRSTSPAPFMHACTVKLAAARISSVIGAVHARSA